MDYAGVQHSLDVSQLTDIELEGFGRKLSRQVLLHIGMIRYAGSVSIKTFDLSRRDVGTLTDIAARLVLGVDRLGLHMYQMEVANLLTYVGDMEIKPVDGVIGNSVRKDLQTNMIREMKEVRNSARNRQGYWRIY
ncbi:hypothetical protein [Bacillus mycoides]|uniref:hypothetical protein n=1 Tax=Bacillus mycoides TaxID=1405 RepID=UPI003A80EEDB